MELYLDSADIKEIDEAFKLGFLTGLTTTPTFMHRGGVTNIDKMILDLAKKVPILQVEALGETAEEVVKEAKRQLKMGLKKETTVFKIPVSLEGLRACRMLRNEGIMVNVHLVYTLQQAYMAMQAGANYVCPLVGRLQDQGHDALSLVEQCVEAVNYYGYDSKIMFSSVRTVEHVRNAVTIGVHTITVPWKLMKQLTDNHFTTIGTQQFYVDTRLITMKVKDILSHTNPVVKDSSTVSEALVEMTKHGFGAVMIDAKGKNTGVFTDGGLRRGLEKEGNKFLTKKLSALKFNAPFTISPEALLDEAQKAFKEHKVDTLSVSENGKQLGMLDIQDLMKAIAARMIQGEHPIDRDPFQELGTELLFSHEELKERLSGIRAVLFDWDGVFNDGWKDIDGGSPFSEVGSMGVNMLRFGLWLQNDERLPSAAVITGQHNGHAERFAQREKLHGLYMGFINKVDAFDTFLRKHGLNENEVAFFYDDAIDLAVAARCGLRILLRGQASEFFVKHAVERGSVDIITALSGGQNGLREATDALLTLMGRYSAVIDHRAAYSDGYQRYLKARNATVPEVVSGIR